MPVPTTQATVEVSSVIKCEPNENRLFVPLEITDADKKVGTQALIDSGADGLFIDYRFVIKHRIPTNKLRTPIVVRNVDGTINRNGTIQGTATLNVHIGPHTSRETFLVTELGEHDVILGHQWLEQHNPCINWQTRTLALEDIQSMGHDMFYPRDIDALSHVNKATELAQEYARLHKDDRPITEKVPAYLHDHLRVFDMNDAKRFPPSRPYDHKIELKPGFQPKRHKIYPLSVREEALLDEFIDDNLAKGYIKASESPQASPVFFVGKKDGEGRLCQDYRDLNEWTIKNAYPLPRIGEIMDMAQKWKYFTTIDVKSGYNNIRMANDEAQQMAAFTTRRGLFQPTVMFFGLCNSPATFQAFMDDIYGSMLRTKEVSVYMDDIFTGGETLQECQERTRRVIEIMDQHELHAKIEKCRFNQTTVPYLGMIISHGQVSMDPTKLDGIASWPVPKDLKEV